MIDYNIIISQVEEAAYNHYGPTFKFRPNQKEAVASTIYSFLNGYSNDVILQGPTGSGKSAIGLLVAAVLSEKYGKKGYIVISDLSLIQQYERDCQKFFSEYSVIKGQQTYKCFKNGLTFSAGMCKLKGCKTYAEIYKKFPGCVGECQYLIDREQAIKSKVTVCTYSFWLIQQNVVKKILPDNPPFPSRDFVICDEAHKLVGIVQSHFSPSFSTGDIGKFRNIVDAAYSEDTETVDEIDDMRNKIKYTNGNQEIFNLLKEYIGKFKKIVDAAQDIKQSLSEKIENGEELNKDDRTLLANSDFVCDHFSTFDEYINIIEISGVQNLVKNPVKEKIIFNCIDESYLMGKYFHANCGYKMYMSATIGEPHAYAKDVGINLFYNIDIPSTFNFEKSPIFYVPEYKLSYKEKEYSLPKIAQMITSIINMYTGKRGIIQTGSYDFAKTLIDLVPDNVQNRIILYDDSKGKDEAIAYFKSCEDKILVGPSLIEGLSFDDDLCRFQIIMKVPYPSLADKFVKAKQEINPSWYSNTAAISILQGVGRGIRSEYDWCVTFILDGCFTYLLQSSYSMFPIEFINRIKTISPYSLGCK